MRPGLLEDLIACAAENRAKAQTEREKVAAFDAAFPLCQQCGACCEHYDTIDVYRDDENYDWLNDNGYLESWTKGRRMMQDTNGRCIAFEGEVGVNARCTIYEHRPEACQDYERGAPRCRTVVFVEITRKGKPLFTDEPESWPKENL